MIPARLMGRKAGSGGRVEILLLRRLGDQCWEALLKPGKRVGIGTKVEIVGHSDNGHGPEVLAEVTGIGQDGIKEIRFSDETLLPELGEVPLPPYIRSRLADPERYQPVYASVPGSVAAPTAGLHFTPELMERIRGAGASCLFVTLHVGLDTFRPVKEENPVDLTIYSEFGVVSTEVAQQLSQAKAEGRRVICIGTTTVRILEQAAQGDGTFRPFRGWADLFILPGHRFRMVDGLVTNFHLPRSTLLMLVTAFAGGALTSRAYQEAVARCYHFYSFGDAMLIL